MVRSMIRCPGQVSSSSVETQSPLQCIHSVWAARIGTVVHYFELAARYSKPVPPVANHKQVPCSPSSPFPWFPSGFSHHPLSPGHILTHASLRSVHLKLHLSLQGESAQRGVTLLNITAVSRGSVGDDHTVTLLTRGFQAT